LHIMCSPESNSYRVSKGLLIAAEAVAVLGCLYAAIGAICYRYYSRHGIYWGSGHISVRILGFGESFLRPMLFSFAAASLVLLIISPFFMWSPLRRFAIKAWIIGLLALGCAGYFASWF